MTTPWLWIGGGVVVAGVTALVVAKVRKPATPSYFAGTTTTTTTRQVNIEGSPATPATKKKTSAPGPSGVGTRDYRINYQPPTKEASSTVSGGVGGYGGGTDAREVYPTPIL